MDFKKIGIAIKQERKKKKFTQQYLGEKINKTESSIRKYEKGLVKIPLDVIEQLADVLEISPFTLAGAEYLDEKFNSKKISAGAKELEDFLLYLRSIGFSIKENSSELILTKNNKYVVFTIEEFVEFQKTILDYVEFQVSRKEK